MAPLFGAAPVTHIYFAELYMDICKPAYTKKERESFMRGTLFPDIRYLARIPRKKTHVYGLTLEDVINTKDAFTAGKLFHSFVDEQREKITEREKIYELVKSIPKKAQHHFIKGVEDELCYKNIDVKFALHSLKEIDLREKESEIPYYTVRAWHRHLKNYLQQSPLQLFQERSRKKQRYLLLSAEEVAQTALALDAFSHNKKLINYFEKLTTAFKKMFNDACQQKVSEPSRRQKSKT